MATFKHSVSKFVFEFLRDNERLLEVKVMCAAIVFGMMCFPQQIAEIDEDDLDLSWEERYNICNEAFHGKFFELLVQGQNIIFSTPNLPHDAKRGYYECLMTLAEWLAGEPRIEEAKPCNT